MKMIKGAKLFIIEKNNSLFHIILFKEESMRTEEWKMIKGAKLFIIEKNNSLFHIILFKEESMRTEEWKWSKVLNCL